jgi:hypothetical protein
LVVVIPEVTLADLPDFSKEFNMENALWATDPANTKKISTSNIWQKFHFAPGGKMGYFNGSADVKRIMGSPNGGTFRYVVDGLTDSKAKDLWWLVERQKPDAVKILVSVSKQKTTLGIDAVKILNVVKSSFEKREAELVDGPVTMATYESLESLLTESQGLELKKATARYKELGKAKELKDELQARSIYQQCQEQLVSQKGGAPEAGKANLVTLAKKFPNTKYGQLAATVK